MGITMEEQLDMVESLIMEEVMDQEQLMHKEEQDNSEIAVDLRHIADMDSCQNIEEVMMICRIFKKKPTPSVTSPLFGIWKTALNGFHGGILGNRGLAISKLPGKGRCLFTTKDFNPGEVIITEEPYVCMPKDSVANYLCDACFEESGNLNKCSRCKTVYYCSTACQKSEWKLHRLECEALSKVPLEFHHQITPRIRLMIRLQCRLKLQYENTIPTSAMDNHNLVNALVSRMLLILSFLLIYIDAHRRWHYAMDANLVSMVLQWPDINKQEVAVNFSKMAFNAFTIFDSELQHLGEGLYPVISFMNHSCVPNCILVFEGRTALISYIELVRSTVTRQKTLKEQYLFTCTCPRCIKVGQCNEDDAYLDGYQCTSNECDGFLLCDSDDNGFICQQCGQFKSKEEIREMESEIKSLQEKALIAEQSACSYYSVKRKDWREAVKYCKLAIALYQKIYPGYHPPLELQYYGCGKFEGYLGEAENAVKSLTKAVDIMKITYGTSTPFMKKLFSILEEQRVELEEQHFDTHQ
ncbi:PREDICTED: histone-lysine N-methyltransferase ASHR1-like [Fragaria vesca subsp. vesca]